MRKDHTNDYMNYIMTTPQRDRADYNVSRASDMRVLSNDGLGNISSGGSMFDSMSPLVIGVGVFVISAFTAVTIYIIMSQMRRGR